MPEKIIVFLTDFDLENPTGSGYNRTLNYAKALSLRNIISEIYSSRYSYFEFVKRKKINKHISLFIGKRLNYKSTFAHLHFKRYFFFISSLNMKFDSLQNIVFFLYNSTFSSVTLSLLYLKLIRKRKVFIEKNELQTAIALNIVSGFNSLFANIFFQLYRIIFGLLTDFFTIFFDGIIAISTRFRKLYSIFNNSVLLVPILVDDTNHDIQLLRSNTFKIGYFGIISESKDGVYSLIQSFKELSFQEKKTELHLYGSIPNKDKLKFEKILSNTDNIFYHGIISTDKVKNVVTQFDILTLIRPSNLQTEFGFSTKLGEYLISGVPVLLSDVSDNCLYLKDKESAFILDKTKNLSPKNIKNKIAKILHMNKAELKNIGMNGKKIAERNFVWCLYDEILESFLFRD